MSNESGTSSIRKNDGISTSSQQLVKQEFQNGTIDENINRNKPWRVIIRRKISDGRDENQSLS